MELMVTETPANWVGSGNEVAEAVVAVKFSPKMLKSDPGAMGPGAKTGAVDLPQGAHPCLGAVTDPTVKVTGNRHRAVRRVGRRDDHMAGVRACRECCRACGHGQLGGGLPTRRAQREKGLIGLRGENGSAGAAD